MIADLKPYPEYRESGLPWLGQVPGYWGQRRMKFLFKERVQKGFPDEPLLAATQSKGVVRKEDYGARTVTAMKDLHLLKFVEEGDFVISLRSFQGGIEVTHARGIISPAYTILTPRQEALRTYYARFFKSPDFISSLTLFVTGIREGQNIDYERLSRAYLPLPPAGEQEAIGRFLDWANGRLERAIRAKRKVIALLNEQKQAIIHRAVTRGLDPSVPLKPSGIPWLGDIPQHWEAKRLKAIAQIRYGLGQPPRESETGLPLIRATNVDQGRILEKNMVRVDPADVPKTRNAFLKAGEIIVVRSGALTADSAIIPEQYAGAVAGYDMVVTVRSARADFIAMALLSSYVQADQLVIASMRAAQPHLNAEELGTAILLLPLDEEQKQIVEFLRNESLPIDAAISRLEREIELLREYRTRLVADVVTGKLDVREAAARLPEEPAPDTAEDDTGMIDETEPADEGAAA
jgi:type I restriction enzyme S subunit